MSVGSGRPPRLSGLDRDGTRVSSHSHRLCRARSGAQRSCILRVVHAVALSPLQCAELYCCTYGNEISNCVVMVNTVVFRAATETRATTSARTARGARSPLAERHAPAWARAHAPPRRTRRRAGAHRTTGQRPNACRVPGQDALRLRSVHLSRATSAGGGAARARAGCANTRLHVLDSLTNSLVCSYSPRPARRRPCLYVCVCVYRDRSLGGTRSGV